MLLKYYIFTGKLRESYQCGARAMLWPYLVCSDLQRCTVKIKRFRQIMVKELFNDSYLAMVVQYLRRLAVDFSRGNPKPRGI
jgi:hypothetical protein